MTNPKAHAPNATQRSYKAKPIRAVPPKPEMRPADAYFGLGECPNERAFAPTYDPVRRCWDWSAFDPSKHGEPAERTGQRAWWDDGGRW